MTSPLPFMTQSLFLLFFISLIQLILSQSESNTKDRIIVDVTDSLSSNTSPQQLEDAILNRYKDYLRIRTPQPSPNYEPAVEFLQSHGNRIGLTSVVKEFVPQKPVLILKWACQVDCDKKYRSIMLNSHMDVVPVDLSKWNTDPFAAEEDETGKIFARGAQDMKCVGTQYLEAIDQLKQEGFKPNRDIYVTFVPDEEIGGETGAKQLSESSYFRDEMRVGVAFDEGGPLNEGIGKFMAFYGERQVWWLRFHARGEEGHASSLIKNPATEKTARIIEKIFEFRRSQERELEMNQKRIGDVVSINLTEMLGSKNGSLNVIPGKATLGIDVRIPPHTSKKYIKNMLEQWAKDADCTLELVYGSEDENPITSRDGAWWQLFQKEMAHMGYKLEETIFQAATDARYIRDKGIPCIGFSPIDNTPWLLHDHNEYLTRTVYLNGIKIYKRLISSFASADYNGL